VGKLFQLRLRLDRVNKLNVLNFTTRFDSSSLLQHFAFTLGEPFSFDLMFSSEMANSPSPLPRGSVPSYVEQPELQDPVIEKRRILPLPKRKSFQKLASKAARKIPSKLDLNLHLSNLTMKLGSDDSKSQSNSSTSPVQSTASGPTDFTTNMEKYFIGDIIKGILRPLSPKKSSAFKKTAEPVSPTKVTIPQEDAKPQIEKKAAESSSFFSHDWKPHIRFAPTERPSSAGGRLNNTTTTTTSSSSNWKVLNAPPIIARPSSAPMLPRAQQILDQIDQMHEHIAKLTARASELEIENDNFRQQIDRIEEANDLLKEQITTLEQENNSCKKIAGQMKDLNTLARAERIQLKRDMQKMTKEIDSLTEENDVLKAEKTEFEDNIQKLIADNLAFADKNDELKEQVAALEKAKQSMEKEQAAMKKEAKQTIEKEHAAMKKEHAAVLKEIKQSMEKEQTALKKGHAAALKEVKQSMEKEQATMKKEQVELKKEQAVLKKELRRLRLFHDYTNEHFDRYANQHQFDNYAVQKLQEERRGFDEACTALIEAKQAAKSCFYETERELNALKVNYDKLSEAQKSTESKYDKIKKAFIALKEDYSKLLGAYKGRASVANRDGDVIIEKVKTFVTF
jgi:hypothetical protein